MLLLCVWSYCVVHAHLLTRARPLQCASGIRKFIIRERDELNVAKWHTLFGTLVYLMGATTAVLGVEYGYLELESSRPWGILIMVGPPVHHACSQ